MKIKSVFILLNIEKSIDSRRLQPLGISYLQSSLLNTGFECDILDCNVINNNSDKEILRIIKSNGYNMVGFSVFTRSYKRVIKLAKKIKKYNKDIFINVGGVHSTICHKEIIRKNDCIDFAIRGDGENPTIELFKDIEENGRPTHCIDGISYKSINGIERYSTILYQEMDLSNLPFPTRGTCTEYSRRNVSGAKTFLHNIAVSSSRGCPYNCAFCSIPHMALKWRPRTPESVSNEIYEIYKKHKNIFIVFTDDNFFVDQKRALKIVEQTYAKCGEVIPFSFATRVDQINCAETKILERLKELGCTAIELGIENGSNAVLSRYKKNTTVQENKQALGRLKGLGISIGIDYILFDRFTTVKELQENIVFLKEAGLWGYYPTLIYKKVIPYPGTFVETEYRKIKKQSYFLDKNVKKIFYEIERFSKKFGTIIEQKIENVKKSFKIITLKTTPYVLLELLVNNIDDKTVLMKKLGQFNRDLKKFLKNME